MESDRGDDNLEDVVPQVVNWNAVCDPAEGITSKDRDRIADLAYRGRWKDLIVAIDSVEPYDVHAGVNSTRLGSKSNFTPLHQAAWAGNAEACSALIERGAWRTVQSSDGKRPIDVAVERGHVALERILTPQPIYSPGGEAIEQLQRGLDFVLNAELLRWRKFPLHYPQVGVLTEIAELSLWVGVPGMYGGFRITLERGPSLHVDASSRMGGSELYRVNLSGIDFLGHEGY
ncbi:ankyrin repeat protein [Williamsia muralis]|uniref:Ankyrin repeat protein n=1 Tax=Williamsia marianensis TaxID=85044 RepID=A0A495K7T3_WILMA|nr:ankyrin repeat domain-containing protein [Williamsia muralis]RKR96624.1 ankyrin repeat protein [Williamsia muralis]